MIRHGFQRLVLLGSAGYQRAELPLDDAVSLIAPNNTGKTSLINALQFLLIIHRQRMDFGSHDEAKTRRFYFPNNSAYILLEVSLPQTGTCVFGCVGKGVSHDYEYFAYKGPLEVEDYRLPDGNLVQQPQLLSHLASRGRNAYRYDASEFARRIYGGRLSERRNEPDFTIFKLENASNAQTFQQILTRTLRLDKLSSADVKKYLLQIFRNDLPNHNINFKQIWDEAFHEVNADRAQYEAALAQAERIGQMEKACEERLQLRGKVIEWRGRIDAGLARWQDHYEARQTELNARNKALEQQQREYSERLQQLAEEKAELKQTRNQLQRENDEQTQLQQRFALISNRKLLEQQLDGTRTRWRETNATLQQADGRSLRSIEQALRKERRNLESFQRQQRNPNDNLYRSLGQLLSTPELERLNRVLSPHAMVLGSHEFRLDPDRLQEDLDATPADRLRLGGLELNLDSLEPGHEQLTDAQLNEAMEDLERQIEQLERQRQAASALEETRQKRDALEDELKQLEKDLEAYDRLQQLISQAPARQEALQRTEADLKKVEEAQQRTDQEFDQLRQQREQLSLDMNRLAADHDKIDHLRRQRRDLAEEYNYLADMPHHPWLGEGEWSLDQLAQRMETFQRDCQRLEQLNRELKSGLDALHGAGLVKYQYSDSEDQELGRIIAFSHELEKEREALEKKARSAVVNVTASLRELRDGLLTFQSRMREFNRLIGHRRLSDLQVFKIEAEDEAHLVEAIDLLISRAEQVETGDSFELFNQQSVLDDASLDRARQVLIDEGNARQGLKVEDLFRLVFVVGKVGQAEETFTDIDSAASNGTVLMAKLVTGLAMLHLMQDKRHQLHAVCYLDEALALDRHNQASLVETAHEFGFSLIFAAPDPLTTVRYCVPIHTRGGYNYISRDSWQVLEPLGEKEKQGAGLL